jgi:hypothetical protein
MVTWPLLVMRIEPACSYSQSQYHQLAPGQAIDHIFPVASW